MNYELEDAMYLMKQTSQDLELFYEYHGDGDCPMTEDEVANALLGLSIICKMREWKAWDCYIRDKKLDQYATPEDMAYRAEILKGLSEGISKANALKKKKKK